MCSTRTRAANYAKEFKFDNGYGANVICRSDGLASYGSDEGLFEVHVLSGNGEILYDTPVTGDVLGHCDFARVAEVLDQIRSLPPRK